VLAASLLIIGDELLGGYVPDANTPWLATHLRGVGVPLERVHVIPDEFGAIDEALAAELRRTGPRVVLTSGGIGSTPDDITYEAVAASLGRELVEHPVLAERIDGALAWSREQGIEVTEEFAWHLGRMARIPEGARVLTRSGGWAAAVAVDVDGGSASHGTTIVVLPGVPSEFRALVEAVIGPELLAGRNPVPVTVEVEHGLPESALNPTFVRLGERFPGVKLGSYPGRPMLVRLTGVVADEVHAAGAFVRDAIEAIGAGPAGRRLRASWSHRAHVDREGRDDGDPTDERPTDEDTPEAGDERHDVDQES
jgi:molybdenum cofactor synthesis domain-containing protein